MKPWSSEEARAALNDVAKLRVEVAADPESQFEYPAVGRYLLPPVDPTTRYMKVVFSWVPLNPSSDVNSSAIEESFLVTADENPGAPSLPSAAAFQQLFEELSDSTPRTIYIVGPRGCGKTACLNYFLNKHHAALNTDCATWFRTDMSKLYAPQSDEIEPYKVVEYQRAHCFYIALKYASTDRMLSPFRLSNEDAASSCDFFAEALNKREYEPLAAVWRKVVLAYHVNADSSPAFIKHAIGDLDRSPSDGPHYRLLFQQAMNEIVKKRDGKKGRLIQILDGIDNIDRIDGHDEYCRFLKQVNGQVNGTEKPSAFSKTIVVLREETLRDLNVLNNTSNGFGDNVRVRSIHAVRPASPLKVVMHKHPIVKQPRSAFFEEHRQRAIATKRYEDVWGGPLHNFAEAYFETLAGICGVSPDESDLSLAILEKLFNHNLRSMCTNLIATYRYVRTYINRTRWTTPDELHEALKHVLKAQKHVILEGSITAGETTMISAPEVVGEGAWCPNLFDWPFTEHGGRWEGLCLYRALQILYVAKNGGCSQDRLEAQLKEPLKYSQATVNSALSSGWRFGSWRVLEYGDLRYSKSPVLVLTAKGRFLLRVAFDFPAITYLMATGTRFRREHTDNRKMWGLHDPRPGETRRFVPSMVKSGLTLIRYIACAHQYEVDKKLIPESLTNLASPVAELAKWRNDLVSYMEGYHRQRRHDAEQLLLDLRGIVP